MPVVALLNPKGGAGKTSCVVSLAYAYAREGARVLVLDLDQSCNLTYGLGRTEAALGRSVSFALWRGESPRAYTVRDVAGTGIDLLPSNADDTITAETGLQHQRIQGLRSVDVLLAHVDTDYDLVLVDTPGSLGTLQMAGVYAADWVIIPVSPRRDHVLAAQRAIELVKEAQGIGSRVQLLGLLRTLVEKPRSIAAQVGANVTGALAADYDTRVLSTVIPVESRYNELEWQYQPIGLGAPMSRTAIAYRALCDELVAADVLRPVVAGRA